MSEPTRRSSSSGDSASSNRAFRQIGLRPDITNTQSLIQSFNNTNEQGERRLFCRWFRGYVDWLRNENSIEECDVQVLTYLFDLECRQGDERRLQKSLFDVLYTNVRQDHLFSKHLVATLDYALTKIDVSCFRNRPEFVLNVVDTLLSQLEGKPFTKATYECYGAALFALYHAVDVLKKASPRLLTTAKNEEICARLEHIESTQEYYPFAYYARLIMIGVKKLAPGSSTSATTIADHRLFYLTIGSLHFAQALAAVAHSSLDIAAFEAAIDHLQKAFPNVIRMRSSSYLESQLETILRAAEITLTIDDFSYVKKCFSTMLKNFAVLTFKSSTWIMLRFCMVDQLRLLALNSKSQSVRQNATEELLSWAQKRIYKRWSIENCDVFQALLESLHSIYKKEQNERVKVVLDMMKATRSDRFKIIVNEWLVTQTVEDGPQRELDRQIADFDNLYVKVRKKLGLSLAYEDVQFNLCDMKKTYTDPVFAEVCSFISNFVSISCIIGQFYFRGRS